MLTLQDDVKVILADDEAKPVTDFDTGAPKLDKDTGEALYTYQVLLRQKGEKPVVQAVKAPAFKGDLAEVGRVYLRGLQVRPWTMGDKNGLSFTAQAVEDASKVANTAPKAGASS